jgi:hypothetical protein
MKKSELRQLIRESIKELMTEQASVYTKCKFNKCSGGAFGWKYMKINGQTPEAGNIFMMGNTAFFTYVCWPNDTSNTGTDYDCASNSGNYPNGFQQGDCPVCESMNGGGTTGGGSQYPPYTCNYGCPGSTTPCTVYGCTDPTAMNYNATILPNCDQGCVYQSDLGCTDSTASNYDPTATIDDGSCITAAGGCDPSAWSNHANWTSTFTNTVNNLIANPNPNQPCTFLNNKIAQFTNQIPNVGPVWANQLQCKLDLANQLHTQNNC